MCIRDSYELLATAAESAKELGQELKVGNILSADTFYDDLGMDVMKKWAKMGTLAVEMESAGLYLTAARLGKRALTLVTISDKPFTGEATTAEERQNTFTQMMEIALETAVKMDKK